MSLERDVTSEEFFFEYFVNRPTWFTIYFILTLSFCVVGGFINFVIILQKLKNYSNLNGHGVLTINMAVTQIIVGLSSVVFLIDEIHYKITERSWCSLKVHSFTFSTSLMSYSCVMALIVSLTLINAKIIHGLTASAVALLCAIAISIPYVEVSFIRLPLFSGFKTVCILRFDSIDEVKLYRLIMTTFEYFLPSAIIIITSLIAVISRREEVKKKDFIIYPMIVGIFFIVSSSYILLVDFMFFYGGIKIKMQIYFISKLFFSFIPIVNAVTYFWIDKSFFHRCLQFLRIIPGSAVITYQNITRQKDDDTDNLCFEKI